MITRFVIRRKSDGAFLSTRPSQGKRTWKKHINDAAMFSRRGDTTLAMYHIPEVKSFMAAGGYKWLTPRVKCWTEFPVEVMEFNVLLIDANKGYIG